jgi:ATP-binding cassette subfamily B protein
MSIGFLATLIQRGRASFERVAEVFAVEPDIEDGGAPAPSVVRGALRVQDLSYGYGDHRVLDGVSFDVAPGQLLAIVGRTGSGKSTLAALLPRLRSTPRGSVFLDGQDVCDLPLRAVRHAIGYAQQSAFLFSTTIGRNVGFCLEEPDSPAGVSAVHRAAAEAQIEDEIAHLPDGYDTIVGERGVQLSGGQKQRVALARALLAGPSVLVLDDPLSAVDARTERAILDAIEAQRSRRSVVLITHRVAAAARCDKIVVLDHGRVVAGEDVAAADDRDARHPSLLRLPWRPTAPRGHNTLTRAISSPSWSRVWTAQARQGSKEWMVRSASSGSFASAMGLPTRDAS